MTDQVPPKPRIIVDDDWKNQAQAEKQRLAETESAKAPPKPGQRPSSHHDAADPADEGAPADLPPADFPSLVGMLATQALMYLGAMADKKSGGVVFDPEMGRFYIDLLTLLEEKTKGNLTPDEARDITGALHELRARFVEMSRAVAAQIIRERAAATGQIGPPGAFGEIAGPGGGAQPPFRIK